MKNIIPSSKERFCSKNDLQQSYTMGSPIYVYNQEKGLQTRTDNHNDMEKVYKKENLSNIKAERTINPITVQQKNNLFFRKVQKEYRIWQSIYLL